ncbi:hypothetical protein ACFZBZ_44990 [Streptomyces sp. NPDC008196]|uniref:hypothetical protein n=1 Tax=Streptomyces sp. NPDC008196 TaxID=3364819 RepID=UPI0036E8F373
MFVLKRCASTVAAAFIVLAVGLTGPASAGTAQGEARFDGQARAAGLTVGQTEALQAKMDRYLARHGGQQVAANEIRLTDGATLTVTVPGEAYVRDMAAPAGTRSAAQWECDYEYFCMYRETLGMGDRLALYYCQDYALNNWVGEGSYYNNQTRGTQAQFKDQNRTVIHTTLGAPWSMASFDWTPVWYVKPC